MFRKCVLRPWLPSPRRTASGLKSGPKKVFPTVVADADAVDATVAVFLAPPGVLFGVSASEPCRGQFNVKILTWLEKPPEIPF